MKRSVTVIIIFFLLISLILKCNALEYDFSSELYEENIAEEELDKLIEQLPEKIRDKIVMPNADNADELIKKYNFSFFLEAFKEAITDEIPHHLNSLSVSVGMLIIVSLIRKSQMIADTPTLRPAVNMCTCLASSLTVMSFHNNALSTAGSFLKILSDTMLTIVPLMEAIYIAGGNISVAAASSTGLNLMITFSESVFSRVISPAISVCFILSVISAVTDNKGISFMSKTLKGLVTAVLILIMSLMTLALTVQTNISSAADTFASRAIRFALGSYIPIVGGAISDSFSLLKSSVSLIKQFSGITAIVILILICSAPLVSLVLSRLTAYVATNAAGLFECENEQSLYSEIGSCYTMMIAVTLSAATMYIIALSQFCSVTGAQL